MRSHSFFRPSSQVAFPSVLLGCAFWALSAPVSHAQTAVTECGRVFDGRVVLIDDLDCTGLSSGTAITLRNRGSIDLAGFTLSTAGKAIKCETDCVLTSSVPGGTIEGGTVDCGGDSLLITDMDFRDVGEIVGASDRYHRVASPGRIEMFRSRVFGATEIEAGRGISLIDSEVNGNLRTYDVAKPWGRIKLLRSKIFGANFRAAILSGIVSLRDSQVVGNSGDGVHAMQLRAIKSRIAENGGNGILRTGYGTVSEKLKLKDVTVAENGGHGIELMCDPPCKRPVLARVAVEGNGLHGFTIERDYLEVRVAQSTFSGNGTDAACGTTIGCADVAGGPRMTSSLPGSGNTCGTSYQLGSGVPGTNLGICILD